MIKIMRYLTFVILVVFLSSACNKLSYKENIEGAYSNLKIGMTKNDFDGLFEGFKFLKEQVIFIYPNDTEAGTRLWLKNRSYEDLYPKDVFENVTFDRNMIVFSYLVSKESNWPNGWITTYIFIIYDKANNRVVGWGKNRTYRKVRTWGDNF